MKNNLMFRNYLFHPFEIISQKHLLLYGVILVALSGAINCISSTHFDGILDMHTGLSAPIFIFLLEGFLNALTVTIIFFVLIRMFILKKVSITKILIEQIFARWPLIFLSLISSTAVYQKLMHLLFLKYIKRNSSIIVSSSDYIALGIIFLICIVFFGWMVYLVYSSFRKSACISGVKGVVIFIIGLLFAELISKGFYHLIYSELS